jgi:hypothetical protein
VEARVSIISKKLFNHLGVSFLGGNVQQSPPSIVSGADENFGARGELPPPKSENLAYAELAIL